VSALYLSDHSIRGATDQGFERVVKWDVDLLAGYDARFISGAGRRGEPNGFFSMVAPQLWREIRHGAFDALIIHGHTPAAMLIGVAAAKAAGIAVFMRGETHLGLRRSTMKMTLRSSVIRALYGRLDGVLAIGSANRVFYRAMGVTERRIFSMPYAVDNARFMAASRLAIAERRDLRASFGVLDDRAIVLFAAKFQARKRPDDVLRAAACLTQEGIAFQLVMVGSGEMGPQLRTLAQSLGMRNVHFAGFANQRAMPQIYASCDVFVLPSDNEPWGLAINEAMCAGLAVVASAEIGCVPDLVHDGLNGRTFAAGDVKGLADALRPLLTDVEGHRQMGEASRKIISRWSYAECREGLQEALASVGLGV
jgi:glycosyltransferase involved in cell wall biosynthesis